MARLIYIDINESTFVFELENIKFYFSSDFYLQKYKKEYRSYVKNQQNKLKLQLMCNISAEYIFMINLYKKIEKRGFKVLYKNKSLPENYFATINIAE